MASKTPDSHDDEKDGQRERDGTREQAEIQLGESAMHFNPCAIPEQTLADPNGQDRNTKIVGDPFCHIQGVELGALIALGDRCTCQDLVLAQIRREPGVPRAGQQHCEQQIAKHFGPARTANPIKHRRRCGVEQERQAVNERHLMRQESQDSAETESHEILGSAGW